MYSVGELCLSPSRGTPHSGGLLLVNGPHQQHLLNNRNNIRMEFEGNYEVLYTKCSYEEGSTVVHCPVPLFAPNSIGIKNVTLLIGGCSTGYTGQYKVGECSLQYVCLLCEKLSPKKIVVSCSSYLLLLNLISDFI